jgi:uncharacterized membrane protein
MSEDRQNRSDRLKRRFDRDVEEDIETEASTEETAGHLDVIESSEQPSVDTNASASDGATNSEESIKDRPSVLMYLPEELHSELDIRFDELNAQHKREHGRPLEKNRDYYPAIIKASLEDKAVKDILDI